MTEFCTCGSMLINGVCSNKRCPGSVTVKPAKARSSKAGTAKKAAVPKTRKASKCITYNLYDLEDREDNVQ